MSKDKECMLVVVNKENLDDYERKLLNNVVNKLKIKIPHMMAEKMVEKGLVIDSNLVKKKIKVFNNSLIMVVPDPSSLVEIEETEKEKIEDVTGDIIEDIVNLFREEVFYKKNMEDNFFIYIGQEDEDIRELSDIEISFEIPESEASNIAKILFQIYKETGDSKLIMDFIRSSLDGLSMKLDFDDAKVTVKIESLEKVDDETLNVLLKISRQKIPRKVVIKFDKEKSNPVKLVFKIKSQTGKPISVMKKILENKLLEI